MLLRQQVWLKKLRWLPSVVNKFTQTRNLREVCDEQQNIIHQYKTDFIKYENDYNAKDNTEDNKNEERFIISIKTGAFEISIFIILTILIISVVVIKIKIKNKKGESK